MPKRGVRIVAIGALIAVAAAVAWWRGYFRTDRSEEALRRVGPGLDRALRAGKLAGIGCVHANFQRIEDTGVVGRIRV